MRYAIALVLFSAFLSGCAATSPPPAVERDYVPYTAEIYPPAPAAALVFDPPGCPPVEIYREPRGYVVPDDAPIVRYYDEPLIVGGYVPYRSGWERHDYFIAPPVRSFGSDRRPPEPRRGRGGHEGTHGGHGGTHGGTGSHGHK